MRILAVSKIKKTIPSIILFVYEGDVVKQIRDFQHLSGALRRQLVQAKDLIKTGPAELFVLLVQNRKTFCIIVGLGKKAHYSRHVFARSIRAGVRMANELKRERVVLYAPATEDAYHVAYHVSVNTELALYSFGKYQKKRQKTMLQAVELLFNLKQSEAKILREAVHRGQIIGQEINGARDLSNTPGGDMTPQLLAKHAQQDGKRAGFTVSVYDKKKIASLKMGGVLGVSRGSAEEPKFIIAEYKPVKRVSTQPLVFVGKGVTFDTGGLNIKEGDHMNYMHLDMSGGASVIHAVAAIARLKLPVHVVGLIPAVENMPSGSGYRPGDILRARNGKTIEVKNTDAEGRIILADALSYAKDFNPSVVIDLATLTGAAVAALGERVSALMTNDKKIEEQLISAGESTGDRVWPLPFWHEYSDDVKSDFGDVANLAKTKYGGAITAGAFLREFAPIHAWAHIDIAPTMTTTKEDNLSPGSKGSGTHLLIRFAEDYVKASSK